MKQETIVLRSRRYLPHTSAGALQFITWRLADSVPAHLLAEWERSSLHARDRLRARIEAHLDAHPSSSLLGDPRAATIVCDALRFLDKTRYDLLAWVVMPNHVHVLIDLPPTSSLPGVVHSWKSFTAKAINRALGRGGPVWYRDYFDRYIRNEAHRAVVTRYIHENPVKARLVGRAQDWPYSSAFAAGVTTG